MPSSKKRNYIETVLTTRSTQARTVAKRKICKLGNFRVTKLTIKRTMVRAGPTVYTLATWSRKESL